MLVPDEAAEWSHHGLIAQRWRFRTGEGRTVCKLDDATYKRAAAHQNEDPFLIARQRGRQWWWFHNRFYRDDSGLLASDVKAIVSAREDRQPRSA